MNAERVLADAFADHEHLAPDAASVLAEIQHRLPGHTRRSHVRSLAAIGTALAVVAIAVGTTLVVNGIHPATPAKPSTPAHVLTLTDRVGRLGTPIGGRFVDRQHGFVALLRCTYSTLSPAESVDPRFQDTCQDVLESTSDGGATFQRRTLPIKVGFGSGARLIVFDATHLAVTQVALNGTIAGRPQNAPEGRWISSDAGSTWIKVGLQPGPPVSEVPAGAQLLSYQDDQIGPPAVMTPDGVIHLLTPTGPLAASLASGPSYPWYALTQAGGSYFFYQFGTSDHPAPNAGLLVSRDRGRTWQTVHLPPGVAYPSVIGSDGSWTYAVANPASADQSTTFIASKDGGRTWKRVTLPKTQPVDGQGFGVAPAGGVLFDDGSHLWHADSAGAFTRLPDTVVTKNLAGLGPVMVAIRVAHESDITLATSNDGIHWTNATIG
jgi:hypothetical protein